MTNCIFCKIIKHEIPAHKIYEDDKAIVFLDVNPWTRGHCLVVSKKHFQDIFDVDEENLIALISVVKKIASLVKEKLGAVGVNILQNNREIAGQLVPHIHFHIIPRYTNDGLEMSHKSGYKGDDLEKVAKLLTNFG